MFFQPPEKETTNTNNNAKSAGALKSARRKRRKLEQKYKSKSQLLKKEKQRFANSMSSWAESFTMAATWQLKHQVAYWKSRAKALEYENNILRTTLRQYYVKGKVSETTESADNAAVAMSAESGSDAEEIIEEEEQEEEEEENDQEAIEDLVITDEFIDYLRQNVDYRKKRDERKRKQKLEDEMPMRLLESCPIGPTDQKAEYEELYGVHWQRIAALEASMQSQFITNCDRDKPVLWPTIPLRL